MKSIKDKVVMYAVRKIGKNVPFTAMTFFIEEAEEWLSEGSEIVIVSIIPYENS